MTFDMQAWLREQKIKSTEKALELRDDIEDRALANLDRDQVRIDTPW